jgi:hypothetical protein
MRNSCVAWKYLINAVDHIITCTWAAERVNQYNVMSTVGYYLQISRSKAFRLFRQYRHFNIWPITGPWTRFLSWPKLKRFWKSAINTPVADGSRSMMVPQPKSKISQLLEYDLLKSHDHGTCTRENSSRGRNVVLMLDAERLLKASSWEPSWFVISSNRLLR